MLLKWTYFVMVLLLICVFPYSFTNAAGKHENAVRNSLVADQAGKQSLPSPAFSGMLPHSPFPMSTEPQQREVWAGSLFSSSYRVGVCTGENGVLRGVVHLKLKSGKVDVYHVYGVQNQGKVVAVHPSGHRFDGTYSAYDKVEGTIRLKNGMELRLEGKRTHGVQLTETCAPMPE